MSKDFGQIFELNWPENAPKTIPKYSVFGLKLLKDCVNVSKPKPLTIAKLNKNSKKFPVKFPIDSCRIKCQPAERLQIIENQAATAYPVIHERVLWLYIRFLEHKANYGDKSTKKILFKISLVDFVDRLLKKRFVLFVGPSDGYVLLSGKRGHDFHKNNPSTSLKNSISYDEIKLNAFLSTSSHSEFINNGIRNNRGFVQENKELIEVNGVIMGLIGSRFQKPKQMEYQDILITEQQNTAQNGYGPEPENFDSIDLETKYDFRRMWNEFYDEQGILYNKETNIDSKRFSRFDGNKIFDSVAMKKRFTISFDTLLLESEARAKQLNKNAYIHVVGIGLGVWKILNQQEEIFLRTFEQRLMYLVDKLQSISWVNFAWFNIEQCGDIKDENIIRSQNNQNGIKIFMSKRNPADKLKGEEFENSLLIVTWAWDANSLPGNEFWDGGLQSSSDPAAACSSLITELHNPFINTSMISGSNLHIVSPEFGLNHISDYAKLIVK